MTDKPEPRWKCGNEYAPYHRSASHVEPGYRDGWNACFAASQERIEALERDAERLRIRCEAYENAYRIAYQATYQSHSGHWDHTMQGGRGCLECIRAREARENCGATLRALSPSEPGA